MYISSLPDMSEKVASSQEDEEEASDTEESAVGVASAEEEEEEEEEEESPVQGPVLPPSHPLVAPPPAQVAVATSAFQREAMMPPQAQKNPPVPATVAPTLPPRQGISGYILCLCSLAPFGQLLYRGVLIIQWNLCIVVTPQDTTHVC